MEWRGFVIRAEPGVYPEGWPGPEPDCQGRDPSGPHPSGQAMAGWAGSAGAVVVNSS
jgi:hypothetical protein